MILNTRKRQEVSLIRLESPKVGLKDASEKVKSNFLTAQAKSLRPGGTPDLTLMAEATEGGLSVSSPLHSTQGVHHGRARRWKLATRPHGQGSVSEGLGPGGGTSLQQSVTQRRSFFVLTAAEKGTGCTARANNRGPGFVNQGTSPRERDLRVNVFFTAQSSSKEDT